ncbi:uncharacterized protein [Aegilops tauschii subsp. strangulata]|uniref:uncharacterized protein n=1 Tax=Aegilops tauschii subsp. strangulata TaxID=200361 RepID=UPI003CC8B45E
MLFAIAIDALNSLLLHAHRHGLLQRLTTRHAPSSISLFADDVVIFCHPPRQDLQVIRELLHVFGEVSGLRTDFTKCSPTPIRCEDPDLLTINTELACVVAPFPMTYLGIPLSVRKPSASSLQPIADKLSKKLASWRAMLLSRGERLALVCHVLSAMPSHILVLLALCRPPPPPVLKQINRILREFLWYDRKETQNGHGPVHWQRVCRPLELGGLGIPDLHRQGIAMRARWLWLQRTDPSKPWVHLHLPSDADTTAIFRTSTTWTVGDGRSCLFWTDYWLHGKSIADIAPSLLPLVPRRRRKSCTVAEGLSDRRWIADLHGALTPRALVEYVHLWQLLRPFTLSTTPDHLSWRWTANVLLHQLRINFYPYDLPILLMLHLQYKYRIIRVYLWKGVLFLLSNEAIDPSATNTPVSMLV